MHLSYAPVQTRVGALFPAPLWESVSETATVNWYERRAIFLGERCPSWREFLFRVHELVHAAWPEPPRSTYEGLAFIGVEHRLTRYLDLTDHWLRVGFLDDLERLSPEQEQDPESARVVRGFWRRNHASGKHTTARTLRWALKHAEEAARREGYLSCVGGFSTLRERKPLSLGDTMQLYERLAEGLRVQNRLRRK